MDREPEKNGSGWTVDTLKSFMVSQFTSERELLAEKEKRLDAEIQSTRTAISVAADGLKVRLDGMNEWRAQNQDERSTYATRDLVDGKYRELDNHIDTANGRIGRMDLTLAGLSGKIDEVAGLRVKVDGIQRSVYIATGAAIVIGTLLSYVLRTAVGGH